LKKITINLLYKNQIIKKIYTRKKIKMKHIETIESFEKKENSDLSIDQIKKYLLSCGYTKSECDEMDEQELKDSYDECINMDYNESKKSKPDFIDLDRDGDREETIKTAYRGMRKRKSRKTKS